MIKFESVKEFDKEFKKIRKKYPSLDADFENFKKILLTILPDELPTKFPETYLISGLKSKIKTPAYIVKQFRCKALGGGGRSGIRITYAFDETKYTFIEIYHKNKKPIGHKNRILKYFKE
ncbi:MAG: hypothetical protein KAU95_01335 [Candidatus Aenigmarchaeota archaeon]|nr:hypothetical protein [Candidatus Aenigmarchaeota archaeon]